MRGKTTVIDDEKLKALMRLKPSMSDTAAFFDCSTKTIERYIKDNYEMGYLEFCERYMVHTRLSIIKKAIDKAEKGDNIMLIFCLKNLCGWKDKWDNSGDKKPDEQQPIMMTPEQYQDYVKRTIESRRERGLKAVPAAEAAIKKND